MELVPDQGAFARALGLPTCTEKKSPDEIVLASEQGCEVEPGRCDFSRPGSAEPFCSGNSAIYQAKCCESLYSFCEDPGLETTVCPTPWMVDNSPALHFNAGGSVCFGTAVGLGGHQEFTQSTVGTNAWLGCTTSSGLEIRIGLSYVVGMQAVESRR
jgi:hypothetical protein